MGPHCDCDFSSGYVRDMSCLRYAGFLLQVSTLVSNLKFGIIIHNIASVTFQDISSCVLNNLPRICNTSLVFDKNYSWKIYFCHNKTFLRNFLISHGSLCCMCIVTMPSSPRQWRVVKSQWILSLLAEIGGHPCPWFFKKIMSLSTDLCLLVTSSSGETFWKARIRGLLARRRWHRHNKLLLTTSKLLVTRNTTFRSVIT